MKKKLAVFIAAMILLACASCFAQDAPFNLGFANINEKATFGKLVKMGFEEACEVRGWTLTYMDNNSDGATAVNNAQLLVNEGVDFAVDLNIDQSIAEVILDIFGSENIPVLAVDIKLGDAPFFGIDSHEMGLISGQYGAEYIKANWGGQVDHVVLFTQIASGDEVQKRCRSAVEALKEAGIEIGEVIEIEAQGDTATAQLRFADFLTANPDTHKIAIFTINENPATGAYAAAVTADREWDIRIFSAGVGSQFVDPMYETQGNQSWISSVACFPELYGEQICKIVEQYIATGEIAPINNAMLVPIDWSNIEEYYPADNLPWKKIG